MSHKPQIRIYKALECKKSVLMMRCPLLCIEKSDNDNHKAFIGSMSYGLCHGSYQKMNDSYDIAYIPI